MRKESRKEATAYYNEIDADCCGWLEHNIALGNLPDGFVDQRSIVDVRAAELLGYRQVHLFAGIGGIPYGLRLGGVPDWLNIWSGGFPCPDISAAGKGLGLVKGSRSGLWREMFRLVRSCRPDWLLIENVPPLRTRGGDRVVGPLERIGYACWPFVVGAGDVGAPHRRKRVWIVAYAGGIDGRKQQQLGVSCGAQSWNESDRSRDSTVGHAESDLRRASGGAGRALGDSECDGLRASGRTPAEIIDQRRDGQIWPAGRGQPQHGWEQPRLISDADGFASLRAAISWDEYAARCAERALGVATDGLPRDVVRRLKRRNKARVKAVGNAVVPQCVALFGKAIMSVVNA